MKEQLIKAFEQKKEKVTDPRLRKSLENKIDVLKGNKTIEK